MLEARLSNGLVVYIDVQLKYFLNGHERVVWFDAETTNTHPQDRTKLKINSKHVVAIREIK